jgi:hypothetical protein
MTCLRAVVTLVACSASACGGATDEYAGPPGWPGPGDATVADSTLPDATPGDGGGDAAKGSETGACSPKTCQTIGAECGSAPDGCGGKIACGSCPSGQFCGGAGANRCGAVPCVPKTCQSAGADCGEISDGCASTISCGSCVSPESCGGGGTPNRCGCTPASCAALGAECGLVLDGCGGKRDCGPCPGGQECGTQTPNRCSLACGKIGLLCCVGSTCSEGYCFGGSCFALPTLLDECADGPACCNLGKAHPPPGFFARYTVTGRPGASAFKHCRHASCPNAQPFVTIESPLTIGPTGSVTFTIENSDPHTDCNEENLGRWECWVEVDGQKSSTDSISVYNDTCAAVATCAQGSGFCPQAAPP